MRIVLVAAMTRNGVIGNNEDIPWRGQLKADVDHFRDVTMGHTVVFGRITWESIPEKYRPLKGRRNIIFTRNLDYQVSEAEVCHSWQELQQMVDNDEVIIICGGEEIYKMFLPLADEMILTIVEGEFEGDTYFPKFDQEGWESVKIKNFEADGRATLHNGLFFWRERRENV